MIAEEDPELGNLRERGAFPPTRWSLVLRAHDADPSAAREALEELFRSYWFPLYSHARRRGLNPHDAEDATQAFCLKLLELESLRGADSNKGRLRSFLLGGMTRFLAQQWRNRNTLKRGGAVTVVSIDLDQAEQRFAADPHADQPVGTEFDRDWAYALIGRVFDRLRAFHETRGRGEVFECLKCCLLEDGAYDPARVAGLGLSPAGLRSAVFQMRQRFRRYIEEEIRDTVGNEADIRGELDHLRRILSGA